jgi:hypothetical protein
VKNKKADPKDGLFIKLLSFLSLTGFEARLRLVDYVDAALTAYDAAIAVTLLKRAERVFDLHSPSPHFAARVRLLRAPRMGH